MKKDDESQGDERPLGGDGKIMLAAGVALINKSRLLGWEGCAFTPVEKALFDETWKKVDCIFGRAALWNMFSIGAENLIKAVLLCNGVDSFRSKRKVLPYPEAAMSPSELSTWAGDVASGIDPLKYKEVLQYRDLGKIIGKNKRDSKPNDPEAPLRKFFKRRSESITSDDANLVFAAFDLLRDTIRNREAHAYVPNVRDAHFYLASEVFLPAFNKLLCWVPINGKTLDDILTEGRDLVSSSSGYDP